VLTEMVSRVCKNYLRAELRDVRSADLKVKRKKKNCFVFIFIIQSMSTNDLVLEQTAHQSLPFEIKINFKIKCFFKN